MTSNSFTRAAATCGAALALGLFHVSAPATLAADPTLPPAAGAKPGAARPAAPSNTTFAQRTVRIVVTGGVLDLSLIMSRLKSLEVAGAIGQEVLGIPPDEAAAAVGGIEWNNSDVGFKIDLDPATHPKARPAAKEFADRLVGRLPGLLAEEQREQEMPRLQQAREWFQGAREAYDSVLKRLREKQILMGGQSPEGVRASLSKLEDERQRLELELAGMQARQKAVEEWIDRTSRQMDERAKADPVVAELEKALAAHEQLVKIARRQFESGITPQAEVGAAEAKLMDVKIQLLDRQRGTGPGATDPLAALTRELQSLSIDTVDRKARLAFLEKRMVALGEAAASVSDFELIEAERAALRTELEQARQELRQAERAAQAASGSDRIIVLEAKDGKQERPAGSE
jgi:hypothetical protein